MHGSITKGCRALGPLLVIPVAVCAPTCGQEGLRQMPQRSVVADECHPNGPLRPWPRVNAVFRPTCGDETSTVELQQSCKHANNRSQQLGWDPVSLGVMLWIQVQAERMHGSGSCHTAGLGRPVRADLQITLEKFIWLSLDVNAVTWAPINSHA